MEKIFVTKSFLPPIEDYRKCLESIWESRILTNAGPYVKKLESELKAYLKIEDLYFVSNGTIALQIAMKALDLKGEIITTPFSYVATTSSIVWENCIPVFVDIGINSLNLDATLIEKSITPKTSAILATHVYGNPCDVFEIQKIARRHNLKVIYDAAHAFGVKFQGQSLMSFGDISTVSFHATKIFHTIEGGAITTSSPDLGKTISYMRNFGHETPESFQGLGVNGKNSEFHAAMGICNLPFLPQIILSRKKITEIYDGVLFSKKSNLKKPVALTGTEFNYSYYPIIFQDEQQLLNCLKTLNEKNIFPRRYFYPTLSTLPYVEKQNVPVADSMATRVLCLPLFHDLAESKAMEIANLVKEGIIF